MPIALTRRKIRVLFVPFVLATLGFIAAVLFCWGIAIYINPAFMVSRNIWLEMVLPYGLAILVTILFIRPLANSYINPESDRTRFQIYMLYIIATGSTSLFAQDFVKQYMGKLTPLDSISQITQKPVSKYYTCKSYFLDKNNYGYYGNHNVRSRSGLNDLDLYIALPMRDSSADTALPSANTWLVKQYSKSVIRGADYDANVAELKAYETGCIESMQTTEQGGFTYLERVEDDYNVRAPLNSAKYGGHGFIVLKPLYTGFNSRLNDNLLCITTVPLGAFLVLLIILVFITLVPETQVEIPNN